MLSLGSARLGFWLVRLSDLGGGRGFFRELEDWRFREFGEAGVKFGGVFEEAFAVALGEVEAADVAGGGLEAVEDEGGAAGVDAIAEEGVEDVADGELNGGAVFEDGKLQGKLAFGGDALAADAVAGSDVEIAEIFVAEGDGAAGGAVGFDVNTFFRAGCWHGFSLSRVTPPTPSPLNFVFNNLGCGKLVKI